jgi:2-dehydropantoate 2-reductase
LNNLPEQIGTIIRIVGFSWAAEITTIMRILVIGAGGVGGYFGAVLARAGNDVTFLARNAQLAALQSTGLKVSSPHGDFHLERIQDVEQLTDVGGIDVVVLAVKSWQVADAARALSQLKSNNFVVVPLQNWCRGS